MAITRGAHPELYDSFHEGADRAPPSVRRAPPPLPPGSTRGLKPQLGPLPGAVVVNGNDETVVVAVRPDLAPAVNDALQRAGLAVGGRENLRSARAVIIDAEPSAAANAVTAIRRHTAPDVAVVVVLAGERGSPASAEGLRNAAKAGAFACLHMPLLAEELQSIVTAAVDVSAARAKVASLSKKLDLDAHLASIGRISAGLTHEIANPLGIASANIEVIAAETERMLDLLDGIVQAPFADLPRHLREAQDELSHARGPDGVLLALRDSKTALRRIGALLGTMRDLVGGVGPAHREKIDLLAIANEIAKRWLAHERGGVQVSVVGSNVQVPADAILVQQILHNITANAIHAVQAQPDAHVRLHIYEAEGYAIVSVRDNGPGIPPELHDRVFEPFFTTRRGIGGTGLGLALCREYAARMNADLSLWSVVGRGTCFRLTIPLA